MVGKKKAQVTVFIILAIAIVIVLVLLFVGRENLFAIFGVGAPIEQIKACAQDPVEEVVDILAVQGGALDPELYYMYDGNKVEYLCYTEENYALCVMQKPLLKQSIEFEIETYIKPRVELCINSVKSSLEGQGYAVSMKNPEISVSLIPNSILTEIELDLTLTKEGSESYESIKADVSSNLYDQVMIASSILNWEARYGDSETMNYMMYYPSLKVEKKKQGEGTTIYILTDRDSEDKFVFASRSLVLPAGLTGN